MSESKSMAQIRKNKNKNINPTYTNNNDNNDNQTTTNIDTENQNKLQSLVQLLEKFRLGPQLEIFCRVLNVNSLQELHTKVHSWSCWSSSMEGYISKIDCELWHSGVGIVLILAAFSELFFQVRDYSLETIIAELKDIQYRKSISDQNLIHFYYYSKSENITNYEERYFMRQHGLGRQLLSYNESYYALSIQWYHQWCKYTLFEDHSLDMLSFAQLRHRMENINNQKPGCINNFDLQDKDCAHKLKSDLKEGVTHIWIDSPQWNTFLRLYSGGPAFQRLVEEKKFQFQSQSQSLQSQSITVNTGTGNLLCYINEYPQWLQMKLYKIKDKDIKLNPSSDDAISIAINEELASYPMKYFSFSLSSRAHSFSNSRSRSHFRNLTFMLFAKSGVYLNHFRIFMPFYIMKAQLKEYYKTKTTQLAEKELIKNLNHPQRFTHLPSELLREIRMSEIDWKLFLFMGEKHNQQTLVHFYLQKYCCKSQSQSQIHQNHNHNHNILPVCVCDIVFSYYYLHEQHCICIIENER